MRRPQPATRRLRQHGYMLLGLIAALAVLIISMTVAVPNVKLQARRELEIEFYHRGDHMAEAIARFYSQGKLGPAGLVIKTPPPPQGFLLELKKLRDGVTIGVNGVYFCRASAYVDPLTDDEWEPIRIGDPRLRKYFRAWQQATGRQLPPIYATYIGGGAIVDTTEKPDEDDEDFEDEDEFDEDEEDDEDYDDDEEDEEEDDEGDEDELQSRGFAPGTPRFVRAAFQADPKPETGSGPVVQRPDSKPAFGGDRRSTPIIGVVSKRKGMMVKTRFGIEKYEEMIFIYFPPQFGIAPGQVQQQQPNPPGQGSGTTITDANGDGIDDSIKPNPNANTNRN
jgi:hypothetical protein